MPEDVRKVYGDLKCAVCGKPTVMPVCTKCVTKGIKTLPPLEPRTWAILRWDGHDDEVVLAFVECNDEDDAAELFRGHTGSKESLWTVAVTSKYEMESYKARFPDAVHIKKEK